MSNVIEVTFGNENTVYVDTTPFQYNNGMVMQFTDIELPTTYQVHFSNSRDASTSLESIGTADGVSIPDDVWSNGLTIYAWIYLHPTETSGVTCYEVQLSERKRAGLPDGTEPTPTQQTVIDEAITALNNAVDACEDAVEQTEANVSHYPIITDGYWYVWNAETSAYVNTEVKAEGETGNGISSIVKTSTADLVDTYTITYTDGTTTTYTVTNGANGSDYVLTETDKTEIANLVSDMSVVEVSGTSPVIVAEANTRYVCGELSTLDFTPSDSGICDVIFTSGSTATVVTLPNDVVMPSGYSISADTKYELNFMDGLGVFQSWSTT